jgi:hypothetical protein
MVLVFLQELFMRKVANSLELFTRKMVNLMVQLMQVAVQ